MQCVRMVISQRNDAISMARFGCLVLFLSVAMHSLPILAQGSDTASASALHFPNSLLRPRIAGAIDDSSLITLRGNTHPLARPEFDQGQAPISMPANRKQGKCKECMVELVEGMDAL